MSEVLFKCNSNLEKMEPHYNSLTEEGIKRMHFNEVDKPILPIDILFKDIEKNLNTYPEMEYVILEKVASKHYGVGASQIAPVNGSDEGIDISVRVFCNPGDTILIPNPSFGSYAQCGGCFGCKIERFDLKNDGKVWFLDIDEFINFGKQVKPKLIFLPNPLAQVGAIIKLEDIVKVVEAFPESMIVADEAYIEFAEEESALSIFNKYQNITILRTVSKFYGLPGIRVGFMISHFKDDIFKVKMPDNLDKISCKIACNLFENLTPEIIENRKKEIAQKKADLIEWLKQFDEIETIYESRSHFVYIKLKCLAEDFAKKILTEYNAKIRIFGPGRFEKYCRISI